MTSQPPTARSTPRPARLRRWLTLAAGSALACVGLVAAHAGSMNLLHVEWDNLTKATDGKPLAVQVATGARSSYSTASPQPGPAPGAFARASQASASGSSPPLESVGSGLPESQASEKTNPDAVGLFELSPRARPMALAVSNDPLEFGDRFRGLIDGASSAAARPAYGGSGRRRAQSGLAGCCDDPATQPQQDDPQLTAPRLADSVGGPVPELGAWMLMISGFGLSGLVLRGERRRWAIRSD